MAGEIEARGAYSSEVQRIQLAVGLPPAHFGAQVERFTQYFGQRGMVEFEVQGKPYSIYIEDVACFPQAYAAAATMLHTLVEEPKAVILDIGGFTADYLLMKNGEIDLTSCDSLENGVILLYNKVRSKVNSELDLLLDEGDVDAILMGKKTQYPDAAIRLTEQMAQEFINDLFSTRNRSPGCPACVPPEVQSPPPSHESCLSYIRRPASKCVQADAGSGYKARRSDLSPPSQTCRSHSGHPAASSRAHNVPLQYNQPQFPDFSAKGTPILHIGYRQYMDSACVRPDIPVQSNP